MHGTQLNMQFPKDWRVPQADFTYGNVEPYWKIPEATRFLYQLYLRSGDWRFTCDMVDDRSQGWCEDCKALGKLNRGVIHHHEDYHWMGDGDEWHYVVLVCKECNYKRHHKLFWRQHLEELRNAKNLRIIIESPPLIPVPTWAEALLIGLN